MSLQDIIFLVMLIALLFIRKSIFFVYAGLACLVISIPLFYFWIFFTAQRLTYYAAAFFLIALVMLLINIRKSK